MGGASAGVWSLPWTPPPSASRPVPSPARASSAAWPSAPATAAAEFAASSLTNFCIAAGVRGEESGHADAKLGARGARSTRRRSAPRAGTDGARRKSEGRAKATQSEEGGVTRPARRRMRQAVLLSGVAVAQAPTSFKCAAAFGSAPFVRRVRRIRHCPASSYSAQCAARACAAPLPRLRGEGYLEMGSLMRVLTAVPGALTALLSCPLQILSVSRASPPDAEPRPLRPP